jgi:succinate dehydrogenase / fumarate reductase flavoprotein subunit
MLESKTPSGNLENKWTDYKGHCKLVNPANKRKLRGDCSRNRISWC